MNSNTFIHTKSMWKVASGLNCCFQIEGLLVKLIQYWISGESWHAVEELFNPSFLNISRYKVKHANSAINKGFSYVWGKWNENYILVYNSTAAVMIINVFLVC